MKWLLRLLLGPPPEKEICTQLITEWLSRHSAEDGKTLRVHLAESGHHVGVVRFHMLMAELENAGVVVSFEQKLYYQGEPTTRRFYRLPERDHDAVVPL